jgi:hypothetical protein
MEIMEIEYYRFLFFPLLSVIRVPCELYRKVNKQSADHKMIPAVEGRDASCALLGTAVCRWDYCTAIGCSDRMFCTD